MVTPFGMVLKISATKNGWFISPPCLPCDNWLILFLAAQVSKNPVNMVRPMKHPKGCLCFSSSLCLLHSPTSSFRWHTYLQEYRLVHLWHRLVGVSSDACPCRAASVRTQRCSFPLLPAHSLQTGWTELCCGSSMRLTQLDHIVEGQRVGVLSLGR